MALSSAGVLYAHLTRPLLIVNALPDSVFEKLDPPAPSPKFADMAQRHLPQHKWAADAAYRHKDENTFVYSRDYLLGNEKRSISLKPFAIVMADKLGKGEKNAPVTMVADAAQLDFSAGLTDNDFDAGRVTSGQLLGEVQIDGPDNLLIKGRNFFVDENSRRIWSDDIVQFRFGPHRGRGRGVEIRLGSSDVRAGLLAAEAIRSVRIREDIILEMLAEGDRRTTRTTQTDLIHVRSRGHLEFDLETNIARLEGDVRLRKPTGVDEDDSLKCDLLSIYFQKTESRTSDQTGLKPRQLTAEGNVELQSIQNELLVTQITDLEYRLDTRVIELANSIVFPDGSGPPLKVTQQSSDMVCRRLILAHDEENELRSLSCPGAGMLTGRSKEDTDTIELVARWMESLTLKPDRRPDIQLLEMSGKVSVLQPLKDTQLSANSVRLWIQQIEAQQKPQNGAGPSIADGKMKPLRLEADESVFIKSPQMSGPTNRLVVVFEGMPTPGKSLAVRQQFSPASFQPTAGDKSESESKLFDKQFNVKANLIQARVRLDAPKEQSGLPEVHLHGKVSVASTDQEEPMVLRGDSLHVLEDESGNQTMNLKGTASRPALVQQLDRLIEGVSIYLDRVANEAEVEGAGTLKFIVDKDFEGKQLSESEPMTISWTKDMSFKSDEARLHGKVTARLGDDKTQRQELICPEMRVHFSQPISFTEGISGGDEAKLGKLLERIDCLGGVTINSFEFSQGRTAEERHAYFQQVTINQKTGNTEAAGPGWITSWTQDRPRLSKAVSARANTSIKAAKPGWNYTRIDFLGELKGNYRNRMTTFNRNVAIVYGPVERLSQVIDPDAGADGELPEDAVRISCDTLQVTERENKDGPQTVEVLGTGNAQLDGRKVHAEADEIKYDQYKELFTLLGKGNRLARLWQRDRVGAKWRGVPGRRFEYSARNQGMNASGVTGGSSGF
jgi:hypothetical protein